MTIGINDKDKVKIMSDSKTDERVDIPETLPLLPLRDFGRARSFSQSITGSAGS